MGVVVVAVVVVVVGVVVVGFVVDVVVVQRAWLLEPGPRTGLTSATPSGTRRPTMPLLWTQEAD